MAKVKMLSTMAGPERTARAGDIVDLEPAQAEDLIAQGYAVEAGRPDMTDMEIADALQLPSNEELQQALLDKENADQPKAPADFKRDQELVGKKGK